MTSGLPHAAEATAEPPPRPRVRVPLLMTGLYWACVGVTAAADMPTFTRFLARSAALLMALLVFLGWWLINRRVSWADRLLVLAAAVAAAAAAVLLADKTLGPITLFNGLPVMVTSWAAWLVLARHAPRPLWRNGLVAVLFLSMSPFPLLRMEGLDGEGGADLHWRWSRRPEDLYFAGRAAAAGPTSGPSTGPSTRVTTAAPPVALRPGDWPGFRGAGRDSVVRGVTVATDWEKSPPRLVWRQRVGPGWSSATIVDGRVYTQEQRGDTECVVCRDAADGSELWSHAEPGRFWDSLSSLGPRATPTFADGRIYAQGAAGTLACLDAATGRKLWSRDTLVDSNGKLPDWGVCSSPLVTHGLAIVFAAGQSKKGLLAYRADTGDVAWSFDAGLSSYSSPHLATITGREQVLFLSNAGLFSVDPATGAALWTYAAAGNPRRSLQPMPFGEDELVVSLGMEAPTELLRVTHEGGAFAPTRRWTSRNLKPSFNDFVVHDAHAYGFDGSIFTCVDLKTGDRKWKKGRYGTGQVLLLADQPALLVLSDKGEVVLVAARPDAFEELSQIPAISGKTWNHPAVAQGRLYVRNAEEMACYELPPQNR